MSTKRFRIALSFAGEKRDFVEQVARILADRFGEDKILYDEFHEDEFAIYDLGIRLPKLYGQESDLIVPVLCPRYDEKRWTGWEWVHIYGLLTKTDGQRVMPCRFEYAEVDGLSPASGYIELDRKTPEQLAVLILKRLAGNEGLPKDHYLKDSSSMKVRPRVSIPNNLPRIWSFFGRQDELAKIAEALLPAGRGWGALIDGPGGIGKTALAVRAAQLVPEGRFQRIIFLSAKSHELLPDGLRAIGHFVLPSYLEMLNGIAREIDRAELTKLPAQERSAEIVRVLQGQEILLLLDNLENMSESDRHHIFAFLNQLPMGCNAIVTSRRRTDANARTVRLDKLDLLAAQELLAELARDNDRLARAGETERQALYAETGGNPLLMRWVVGQLGRGRCRTIADAITFLKSATAGNDPLEFIFGDLLDTFTDNETQVLAALTYFTQPIATQFIAELAGLNLAAADGALTDLSIRALVLPDDEDRQFVLVPLVADFLRKKRPEVVATVGDRLEKRAYALIVENGYQKFDRFPMLDAAWPEVAPALQLFLQGSNSRLQSVCAALRSFLNFTGRWDEWLELEQRAEAIAMAAGNFFNAGWRAHYVGCIHSLQGDAEAVLASADRAEKHWLMAKSGISERAVAIRLRGLGQKLQRDYTGAITNYRTALQMWLSLSAESDDVAIVLNSIAEAERAVGNFEAAEQGYLKALRVAKATNNSEGIAIYTGNLAALAIDLQDWPKAETLAREALDLSRKVGHKELIAFDCQILAQALTHQGQSAKALPYAREAVKIFAQLRSPDLAEAQTVLAECQRLGEE